MLLGPITGHLLGTPWFGGSAFVGANRPFNPAFSGLDFFVQGALLDIGCMFPGPDVQLARAVGGGSPSCSAPSAGGEIRVSRRPPSGWARPPSRA